MTKLDFFVSDLHRHIEQLHQKQFGSHCSNKPFTVYRGQEMDKDAFETMVANKDELISFSSFLSTSKNREISLIFVHPAPTSIHVVNVLFVMDIGPVQSSTPFAFLDEVGSFGAQEEGVLFSMHNRALA